MANRIQLRRGIKTRLPAALAEGEPAYTTDTHELFIGTGSGNVNMSGGHWYNGTDMSNTGSNNSYSSCPLVKVGDMYLNTSNGYVYECTTAGSGSNVKWTYKGCIKGATGAQGPQGPTGATGSRGPAGANGTNGKDGKDAADYVVTNRSELNTAINAVRTTGGKIILRDGTYNIELQADYGTSSTQKTFIFEGMGRDTNVTFAYGEPSGNNKAPLFVFRDMTVKLHNPYISDFVVANMDALPWFRFENCDVSNADFTEMMVSFGFCSLIGCRVTIESYGNAKAQCCTGFAHGYWLNFIDCHIVLNSGSDTHNANYDLNLSYQMYGSTKIENCRVQATGNQNTNLVYNDNGGSIIVGNTIFLNNAYASVSHVNTSAEPTGVFADNAVSYYATYLSFAAVSGNVFNHDRLATSSNKIILQCPTCMTGNTFTGSAAYVDGQNKTHIIDRNLHDNGLTINNKSSSSVTTNNLQF